MAGLAVFIFVEKLWRHGKLFGHVVAILFIATGILAIRFPWLLPGLHAETSVM
jgi:predicted metal-binding membrane protein